MYPGERHSHALGLQTGLADPQIRQTLPELCHRLRVGDPQLANRPRSEAADVKVGVIEGGNERGFDRVVGYFEFSQSSSSVPPQVGALIPLQTSNEGTDSFLRPSSRWTRPSTAHSRTRASSS